MDRKITMARAIYTQISLEKTIYVDTQAGENFPLPGNVVMFCVYHVLYCLGVQNFAVTAISSASEPEF